MARGRGRGSGRGRRRGRGSDDANGHSYSHACPPFLGSSDAVTHESTGGRIGWPARRIHHSELHLDLGLGLHLEEMPPSEPHALSSGEENWSLEQQEQQKQQKQQEHEE